MAASRPGLGLITQVARGESMPKTGMSHTATHKDQAFASPIA